MNRRAFLVSIVAASVAAPRAAEASRITAGAADVTLTGYCPCAVCCGYWSAFGRTKAQTIPVEGFTLASRQYPVGTIVRIDGALHQVHDLGGPDVPGFDLFFNTHGDALRFGRQRRRVEIVHLPKAQGGRPL